MHKHHLRTPNFSTTNSLNITLIALQTSANCYGIVRALREDVIIDFIDEEEANQFRVVIWRTSDKDQVDEFRSLLYAADTIQKEGNTSSDTIQKKEKYIQKTIQMDIESIQKGIQNTLKERNQSVTELQMSVLLYFAKHPTASRGDYITATEGATEGGTISAIARLQELRMLNRYGGKKNGYWMVAFE